MAEGQRQEQDAEKPIFDVKEKERLYKESVPEHPDGREAELKSFCERITYILHTVNDNEYDAAKTRLKPPSVNFKKAVVYPRAGFVVGVFAGLEVALIKTEPGSDCRDYIQEIVEEKMKFYPNFKYIIGVGVGYAFDDKKCSLADVLVSNKISNFADCKFDKDQIEDRGEVIKVVYELRKIFCNDKDCSPFEVSTAGRTSAIHCGNICSYSALINSAEVRDKFQKQMSKPVGGEMEGGVLLEYQQKRKFEGVIIIKGVSDYGDGKKEKDWQFTAAMAALHYIEYKLCGHAGGHRPPQSPVHRGPVQRDGAGHILEETDYTPALVQGQSSPLNPPAGSYESYVAKLDPSRRPYLEKKLDWNSGGVDADLSEIAGKVQNWDQALAAKLGLAPIDIGDIMDTYPTKPFLQRKSALQKWKNAQAFHATYGALLKLLADTNNDSAAQVVITILNKK